MTFFSENWHFLTIPYFFTVMTYPTHSYIMRICCNCEHSQIIHCETKWRTLKMGTVFQNETSTYFWQIECVKMKQSQIYDDGQKNVAKWNKNPRKKRVLLYPLRLIFFLTWLSLELTWLALKICYNKLFIELSSNK